MITRPAIRRVGIAVVALVLSSSGCNYDSPDLGLHPFAADERCGDLSCPLALGTETDIYVSADGLLSDAVVSPPELATITISEDNLLQVRSVAPGSGTLTVFVDGTAVITQRIDIVPLATTMVVPARVRLPAGPVDPDVTTQLYAGNTMRVVAIHQGADGAPLLGHGVEEWTVTGGSFRTADSPPDLRFFGEEELQRDPALFRDVIADGDPDITVSAGPESVPLLLGAVPPGSAASLDLETVGIDGVLRLGTHEEGRPLVLAYDTQGRQISGIPDGGGVEVHVADETILTASVASWRRLFLIGGRAGTTELTVRFDGIESRFSVRVD